MRIDTKDRKLVMNVISRIRKIVESNSTFYSKKGVEDLDEICKTLETKRDSLDNIINETQKIKKELQEKLELSSFRINDMKRILLQDLQGGVNNENY